MKEFYLCANQIHFVSVSWIDLFGFGDIRCFHFASLFLRGLHVFARCSQLALWFLHWLQTLQLLHRVKALKDGLVHHLRPLGPGVHQHHTTMKLLQTANNKNKHRQSEISMKMKPFFW